MLRNPCCTGVVARRGQRMRRPVIASELKELFSTLIFLIDFTVSLLTLAIIQKSVLRAKLFEIIIIHIILSDEDIEASRVSLRSQKSSTTMLVVDDGTAHDANDLELAADNLEAQLDEEEEGEEGLGESEKEEEEEDKDKDKEEDDDEEEAKKSDDDDDEKDEKDKEEDKDEDAEKVIPFSSN